MHPPARRALIIGGSLGGLFAANLLHRMGWEVAVFERASGDLAGRGAGLGSQDHLFRILNRIAASATPSLQVGVRSRIALDLDGRTICEAPIRSVVTAWDRVYQT